MTTIEIIQSIGDEALWTQLAEEAAELSQAASKVARSIHGTNPLASGMTRGDCISEAVEEYTDVYNVAQILNLAVDKGILRYKRNRWVSRIMGKGSLNKKSDIS